ncbi:MAG TPA: ferrous iron transport protein B [Thermoanaerobaculia bacterium]|nr:ferrous iron transport protein B [Thermoanaerobaculia bacterium]
MSQLAHRCSPAPSLDSRHRKLLLVGQPNVGKSLLFTRLTNRYVTVSNYPGTTVEITSAVAEFEGEFREVIDTPGTNSLAPQSFEERVTRDLLLSAGDADVLQVGDSSNLRRTLLLSLQLAEHEVPFTLCLNMSDDPAAEQVDTAMLSDILGVPVVAASALRRWNLEKLKRHAVRPAYPRIRVLYPHSVEEAISKLEGVPRADAVSAMCGGSEESAALASEIAAARLRLVDNILSRVTSAERQPRGKGTFGALCMHRFWGWPILGAVLYLAWLFVGKLGAGILVDFFENTLFGKFLNPWATAAVDFVAPWKFVHDLLVGQYGIITMALTYSIAIILPVVITFFTLFGILEDSGYLPRLAVMLHRTFRRMGLNGKAVLPMVLGLGCDTMATLTTRILETKKERVLVTILLALGVPCSAQLGVIMAMLGRLSLTAGLIWFGATLMTIFIVGYLAAKVIRGDVGEFIIEIPPMRVPRASNIAIKVLARTEWYLKEAVPLFIVGTLLLYLLDVTHLLTLLQRALAPVVVGALGLPAEASNAFVIGFLRRDYGAAGLFALQRGGAMTANQTIVALTVITLFIPCVANFLVMIRERGTKSALAIAGFIIVYSFGIGALMHAVLRFFSVTLT